MTALSFKKSFQLKSSKVQHFTVGWSIANLCGSRKNQKIESGDSKDVKVWQKPEQYCKAIVLQ